ncbi:MAG: histidine phosphatase family protein [Steroidobacteraceae bacterium]|jgi:broad specificity phosphatase PhoE
MGTIYLVRHAQAAFGTDDYDRLTQIGFAQGRLLGAYFAARHVRFDAVYTGTLRRHAETARSLLERDSARDGTSRGCEPGDNEPRDRGPPVECVSGLDEYKPDALMRAYMGGSSAAMPVAVRSDPERMREHFRRLREALLAWTEDRIQPAGMPAWRAFQDGAVAALVEARRRFADGNVLVVSSGGPIAAIVAAALEAPAPTAIELNLRIRNSSVTEFTMSARRHQLLTFNALPHLDTQADQALTTYA